MFELLLVDSGRRGNNPEGYYNEYRVYILSTNGVSYAQIGTIELRDSSGEDVLRYPGVLASQSSKYGTNTTYDAYKTIDGVLYTKWTSNAGVHVNSWVSYILTEAIKPELFIIGNIGSPANEGTRMPKDFRFEGRNNNGTWDTLYTATDQTGRTGGQRREYIL